MYIMYIYIYIYIYIFVVYIYIYREREIYTYIGLINSCLFVSLDFWEIPSYGPGTSDPQNEESA